MEKDPAPENSLEMTLWRSKKDFNAITSGLPIGLSTLASSLKLQGFKRNK